MDSIAGQLLIAGPAIGDPNFWRTVVLVVAHTDEGALGLVLNRPSETTVGEAVPTLGDLIDPEEGVLVGGPMQQSAVIVLAEFEDPSQAALIAFDDVGVLGSVDQLDDAGNAIREARAFAGHAGWGPGQLEDELDRGDWILEDARRSDAFSASPQALWPTVLTRKGGSYALVARMPADPSLN
jgi:putative transcriptional regulator